MLRSFFIGLSNSNPAKKAVTGFAPTRRMARRFVAGETLDEAVAVVKELNAKGIKAILNHVGESVTTQDEAVAAAKEFHTLINRIDAEALDASITIKPSHVGLGFGRDFCYENMANSVPLTCRSCTVGVPKPILEKWPFFGKSKGLPLACPYHAVSVPLVCRY